jgi:hypothetical protein
VDHAVTIDIIGDEGDYGGFNVDDNNETGQAVGMIGYRWRGRERAPELQFRRSAWGRGARGPGSRPRLCPVSRGARCRPGRY